MKILLLIFILTLGFQSLTKADDIRDFEIEGMSIGDSVLDYFNVSVIKKYTYDNFYNYKKDNKRFLAVQFDDIRLKQYDYLTLHIKNKDKKYIIYEISGAMSYENEIEKCHTEKNIIIEYDGRQHFMAVKAWGGEEAFKKNQKIDKLKDEFAKLKGWRMLRIHYKDFKKIGEILQKSSLK